MHRIHCFLAICLPLILACPAHAVHHVVIQRDGQKLFVTGKQIVEAVDGGMLVLTSDGVLWAIQPNEIVSSDSDETPFTAKSKTELAKKLLADNPDGHAIHTTAHYVICYNTSKHYAQWCGALFERLYWAFHNYWKRRGFELRDAEVPLIAMVFDDAESYDQYARQELGEAARGVMGYYSLRTNRVATYDLTGLSKLTPRQRRRLTAAQVNRLLSSPAAERTVATVIHEATHQIAFNCGLHARYADIPLWVSEGIAMYFETPDLKSTHGWRNIGGVNHVRLAEFKDFIQRRPADSLATLVSDSSRFRDGRTARDAYPESWAVNYFLIRRHEKQFVEYMRTLSKKRPLIEDDPETRLGQFKQAFGHDLKALDRELLESIRKLR